MSLSSSSPSSSSCDAKGTNRKSKKLRLPPSISTRNCRLSTPCPSPRRLTLFAILMASVELLIKSNLYDCVHLSLMLNVSKSSLPLEKSTSELPKSPLPVKDRYGDVFVVVIDSFIGAVGEISARESSSDLDCMIILKQMSSRSRGMSSVISGRYVVRPAVV